MFKNIQSEPNNIIKNTNLNLYFFILKIAFLSTCIIVNTVVLQKT